MKSRHRLISDHMRGSTVWVDKEKLLESVPGVGKTIARTLIAELPELGSLDRQQIAALVGLAPWTGMVAQSREQSRDEFHHRVLSRRGACDIGSDFDRRQQSRRCDGESEVALRDAGYATKAGRVAHLG